MKSFDLLRYLKKMVVRHHARHGSGLSGRV